MDADVVVLGGGPAGACAALCLARRGRRVVLVERDRAPRAKLGECLPPGARAQLVRLGVADSFDAQRHLPAWSTRAAWGDAALRVQDLSFHPHGCAWHLDRAAFEAFLLAEAQRSGVELLLGFGWSSAAARRGRGWTVGLRATGALTARYVVDATGRAASFARHRGVARRRADRLVALGAFLDSRPAADGAALVIEARPGGWWYTAPLPGGRAVAAFVTDGDLVPSGRTRQRDFWCGQLGDTRHIRHLLQVPGELAVAAAPAGTEWLEAACGDGWVAVGDAVASFDPLSSLGLAHALESGRLAGLAVDAAIAGDGALLGAYARIVRRRVEQCDLLGRGFYAMERRWPAAPFWSRRAAAPGLAYTST